MTQHVALSVNTPALIAALEHAFSSPLSILTELTQNARRAGASAVEITIQDDCIVVTDDGCGIHDMSAMLSIAGSGWDQETQQKEQPYGLGTLAALHGAKHICIESQGRKLAALTADILSMRPVPMDTGAITNGARITLTGLKNQIAPNRYGFSSLWSAFPIPVSINGKQVEREDALDDRFIPSSIGHIAVNLDRPLQRVSLSDNGNVFLQGHSVSITTPFSGLTTIHLDPTLFRGRAPDRTQLVDADAAREKISAAELEAVRSAVVRTWEERGDEWILRKYDLLKKTGQLALFNRIDRMPVDALSGLSRDATSLSSVNRKVRHYFSNPEKLTREHVASIPLIAPSQLIDLWSGIQLYSPDAAELNADEVAFLHAILYLDASGGAILTHSLDPAHWVYQLPNYAPTIFTRPALQMPSNEDAYSRCSIMNNDGESLPVIPLDSVSLTGPCGVARVPFAISLSPIAGQPVVIAVGPDVEAGELVETFRDFIDHSDRYDEDEATEAAKAFTTSLCMYDGKSDGVELLKELLRWSDDLDPIRDALNGRAYEIRFNDREVEVKIIASE